jgi:hypothetical protein
MTGGKRGAASATDPGTSAPSVYPRSEAEQAPRVPKVGVAGDMEAGARSPEGPTYRRLQGVRLLATLSTSTTTAG